jgi:hypothetical protein
MREKGTPLLWVRLGGTQQTAYLRLRWMNSALEPFPDPPKSDALKLSASLLSPCPGLTSSLFHD